MRVLFTGAKSFTGYWFVREWVTAGHEVVAACRGDGVRGSARRAHADGARAARDALPAPLAVTISSR
jgi:UDP-glucose 4-epimerase